MIVKVSAKHGSKDKPKRTIVNIDCPGGLSGIQKMEQEGADFRLAHFFDWTIIIIAEKYCQLPQVFLDSMRGQASQTYLIVGSFMDFFICHGIISLKVMVPL
ncbi:hypothetical protein SDC9_171972 [bioreactor metagenome]|uniref:Uncharacterized protein n=1 Tax=bioreactor metagenome TaxID=1076179 RepID=A0A645GLG7_9ZZZZ